MFSHSMAVRKRLDQLLGREYHVDIVDEQFMDSLQIKMLYEFKTKIRERVYKRIGSQDERDKMLDACGYKISEMEEMLERKEKRDKKLRMLKQIMPIVYAEPDTSYHTELEHEKARKDFLARSDLIEKKPMKTKLQEEIEKKVKSGITEYKRYQIPLLYEMDDTKTIQELHSIADRVVWRRDILEGRVFSKEILDEIHKVHKEKYEQSEISSEPESSSESLFSDELSLSDEKVNVEVEMTSLAEKSDKSPNKCLAIKESESSQEQCVAEGTIKSIEQLEDKTTEQLPDVVTKTKGNKKDKNSDKELLRPEQVLQSTDTQKHISEAVLLSHKDEQIREQAIEAEAQIDQTKSLATVKEEIKDDQITPVTEKEISNSHEVEEIQPSEKTQILDIEVAEGHQTKKHEEREEDRQSNVKVEERTVCQDGEEKSLIVNGRQPQTIVEDIQKGLQQTEEPQKAKEDYQTKTEIGKIQASQIRKEGTLRTEEIQKKSSEEIPAENTQEKNYLRNKSQEIKDSQLKTKIGKEQTAEFGQKDTVQPDEIQQKKSSKKLSFEETQEPLLPKQIQHEAETDEILEDEIEKQHMQSVEKEQEVETTESERELCSEIQKDENEEQHNEEANLSQEYLQENKLEKEYDSQQFLDEEEENQLQQQLLDSAQEQLETEQAEESGVVENFQSGLPQSTSIMLDDTQEKSIEIKDEKSCQPKDNVSQASNIEVEDVMADQVHPSESQNVSEMHAEKITEI